MSHYPVPQRAREDAEKPFWISYSDLMTAMMMLFLVVMAVSLVVITNPGPAQEHLAKIKNFCADIQKAASGIEGVTVDCVNQKIDFGKQAEFSNGDYSLKPEAKQKLRQFIPKIYGVVNHTAGKKLLKRVDIEGYASNTGEYLLNLQLSMRRAESVLCSRFDPPSLSEPPLTTEQKDMIRNLFLVGGYSFNNAQHLDEEHMRRVEFKLQYFGLGEDEEGHSQQNATSVEFGTCKDIKL